MLKFHQQFESPLEAFFSVLKDPRSQILFFAFTGMVLSVDGNDVRDAHEGFSKDGLGRACSFLELKTKMIWAQETVFWSLWSPVWTEFQCVKCKVVDSNVGFGFHQSLSKSVDDAAIDEHIEGGLKLYQSVC